MWRRLGECRFISVSWGPWEQEMSWFWLRSARFLTCHDKDCLLLHLLLPSCLSPALAPPSYTCIFKQLLFSKIHTPKKYFKIHACFIIIIPQQLLIVFWNFPWLFLINECKHMYYKFTWIFIFNTMKLDNRSYSWILKLLHDLPFIKLLIDCTTSNKHILIIATHHKPFHTFKFICKYFYYTVLSPN